APGQRCPARRVCGRCHRASGSDPRLERRPARSQGPQGHACRDRARGRPPSAHRPPFEVEARLMATREQARLKTRYESEIRPSLLERFGYSSPMQAPEITKITLNMGVGDGKQDSKVIDAASEQLATIAGQRPNVRRAR